MTEVAIEPASLPERNDALLIFIDMPNIMFSDSDVRLYSDRGMVESFVKFPLDKLSEAIAEQYADKADEIIACVYAPHINKAHAKGALRALESNAKQAGFLLVNAHDAIAKDIDYLIVNDMWKLSTDLVYQYGLESPQKFSGEARNGIVDIVLVSGDGDYLLPFIAAAENARRWGVTLRLHVIAWEGSLNRGYGRSKWVKSVTFMEHLFIT